MDKHEFDEKLEKLAGILSNLGSIYDDMNFLKYMNLLRSRLDDAICELEDMRSYLEAFGDDIDKEINDAK